MRCQARPASRLWLTSYPGHLLDLGVKTRIAQRLTLVQRQTNVINGRVIKVRPKTEGSGRYFIALDDFPQRSVEIIGLDPNTNIPGGRSTTG